MQQDGIKALEVKEEPTRQLNDYLDAWHTKYSVWAEECRSWYKKNKSNGRVYIWGGSLLHLLKTLRTPRFEHYDIQYKNDNLWSFLGNGWTDKELNPEGADITPYIRNSDDPWEC